MSLVSKNKEEVLDEMVELISRTNKIKEIDKIKEAVRDRENLCSTGFESGVAIPHPRQGQPDIVEDVVVAFGRSDDGIDFDALDGQPVYLFFMLAAPDDQKHLRVLARLSRMLKDEEFRLKLLEVDTPSEVLNILKEREEQLL
jgi:fructose-specific phosphotransferase system IIA component